MEKLIADPCSRIKLEEMFTVFAKWWKDSIGKSVPKKNDFKCLIEKRFNCKYNSQTGWIGWRFNNENDNDDEPPSILDKKILNSTVITN